MGGKHNKTDSSNPDAMHLLLCSADPVAMTCIVEAGGKGGMQTDLQVGSQIFCKLFWMTLGKVSIRCCLKYCEIPNLPNDYLYWEHILLSGKFVSLTDKTKFVLKSWSTVRSGFVPCSTSKIDLSCCPIEDGLMTLPGSEYMKGWLEDIYVPHFLCMRPLPPVEIPWHVAPQSCLDTSENIVISGETIDRGLTK